MQEKQNALVWFTNNLRIHDHQLLYQACANFKRVIGIYCFDPKHFQLDKYGFKKTEKFRAKFLIETVQQLRKELENHHISLLVYLDSPENCIPEVCHKYLIDEIYSQKEWTQEGQITFNAVKMRTKDKVCFKTAYDQFLFHPEDIEISNKDIPDVFTNFRKQVEKKNTIRASVSIDKMPFENLLAQQTYIPSLEDLGYTDFETHPNTAFPFSGGESSALARLQYYFFETEKLETYKQTRNGLVGEGYSSKFSPWLANGSLSARTIYWKIKEYEAGFGSNESTYWLVFELIWRDYFKYISLKHGNNIFRLEGVLNKHNIWKRDKTLINKWIDGKTRSDFVNANMIELKKTGWMSNRGRQNVASYFTKELQLDWRIGASYFESMLIDYDVHSNYGNWMYVAGVGNDPRDRKFNVQLQAERYDAQGYFRNLWLQTSLF